MAPHPHLRSSHAKAELVGVAFGGLLTESAECVLLVVVVGEADPVVLLLLEETEAGPVKGLGPFLVER